MAQIRALGEVVLWVHDLEESLRFYRDALGLTAISPPHFPAAFLQAGPATVSCLQQVILVPLPEGAPAFPNERTRRTMHHFGLEVAPEDFESFRDRLESLGYQVRFGEHPFLPLKVMYLDDPDGNEVELIAGK